MYGVASKLEGEFDDVLKNIIKKEDDGRDVTKSCSICEHANADTSGDSPDKKKAKLQEAEDSIEDKVDWEHVKSLFTEDDGGHEIDWDYVKTIYEDLCKCRPSTITDDGLDNTKNAEEDESDTNREIEKESTTDETVGEGNVMTGENIRNGVSLSADSKSDEDTSETMTSSETGTDDDNSATCCTDMLDLHLGCPNQSGCNCSNGIVFSHYNAFRIVYTDNEQVVLRSESQSVIDGLNLFFAEEEVLVEENNNFLTNGIDYETSSAPPNSENENSDSASSD